MGCALPYLRPRGREVIACTWAGGQNDLALSSSTLISCNAYPTWRMQISSSMQRPGFQEMCLCASKDEFLNKDITKYIRATGS